MTVVTTPDAAGVTVAPSAYKSYCADKKVTGVAMYLPDGLVEMMLASRPGVKAPTIAREAIIQFVNAAGLTRTVDVMTVNGEDREEIAWTWSDPKPVTKKTKDEILAEALVEKDKAAKELAAAKAEIEALKAALIPTPPAEQANAATGKVEKKAA